jgi:hypothetical protein
MHPETTWTVPKAPRHDAPFDLRRLSQFEEYDESVFVSGPNDLTLLGSFTPAASAGEKWDNKLQTFVSVSPANNTAGLQSLMRQGTQQLLRTRRRTPSQGGSDWLPRGPNVSASKAARASQPIAPGRRRPVPSTAVPSEASSLTSSTAEAPTPSSSVGLTPSTSFSKKSLSAATGLVLPPLTASVARRPMNPFNYEYVPPKPSSTRRRWAHLFTRTSAANEFIETDPNGPHWKSLTEPASLPLTSDYFPPTAELYVALARLWTNS